MGKEGGRDGKVERIKLYGEEERIKLYAPD
jgi:hypothetical protein